MRTLYATVDDHLLSEIPRFFGSLEVALTEIFQNAYRAGAQHVMATWDEGARMLSIADDGPGLADPGILLVAGRSDWDGHVIEPAGVGAFAALAYAEQITYTSHGAGNWRMSVTPDAPHQCPVMVEELSDPGVSGLTVQLELKPGIPLTEKTIRLARQFYPFTATLRTTQKDGEQTLPPPNELEPQLSLLTSAGRVEWSNAWPRSEGLYEYQRGYACEAVWEYKRFTSPTLRKALRTAAESRSSLAKGRRAGSSASWSRSSPPPRQPAVAWPSSSISGHGAWGRRCMSIATRTSGATSPRASSLSGTASRTAKIRTCSEPTSTNIRTARTRN